MQGVAAGLDIVNNYSNSHRKQKVNTLSKEYCCHSHSESDEPCAAFTNNLKHEIELGLFVIG